MAVSRHDAWKGRRVFLTGHTGFKGSWLGLWLSHMGANVCGFSLPPPTEPSLFHAAELSRRVETCFGDIRDADALSAAMRDFAPEVVIHMAAQSLVRRSYDEPVATYATNVLGTVHVLEAARKTDSVRAVVNVTTDKCYENQEWLWPYRENERLGGRDPYSNSKACAELVTDAYRKSFYETPGSRKELASVRAGNVIGGGDWAEDRLIPDCMRALSKKQSIIIRNPAFIRPWQHVLEPLSGYLRLAERLLASPGAYCEGWNFGPELNDAQPVSWVASTVCSLWGGDAQWQLASDAVGVESAGTAGEAPHEAKYLRLDCSLAKSRLGWTPRLPLSLALAWTVEWYRGYSEGKSAEALCLEQIRQFEAMEPPAAA